MNRWALVLFPAALCAADAQPRVRVDAGKILLDFDQSLHTRVTSRAASTMPITEWSASETVTLAGKDLHDFAFRKQDRQSVRDSLGSGRKFTVTGEGAGLRKKSPSPRTSHSPRPSSSRSGIPTRAARHSPSTNGRTTRMRSRRASRSKHPSGPSKAALIRTVRPGSSR